MTVSDSLIENCNTETRIDHHVDDIDDRASQNSYHTIDGLNSSSSGDGYSSEATKSTKRGLGRPLMIVVAILKSRHLRGPITTESHPLNLATTGRDDRNDDGEQRNRSSNQNRQDYSNNRNSNQNRNQFRNNSNYDNRQYNNNGIPNSNSNFQFGQGYNSRGNQDYEGFNPDSSYRTDQELDE